MITLCVPTFNRPEFIERLLRYYAATGFRHWIFIGDASQAEDAARTQRAVASFSGVLKTTYWSYPGLSACAALEQMSRSVSTPYCAFLGDDDFLGTRAIERCVKFLEDHPDYGAAHGRGIFFQLEQPGPYGDLGTVGPYPQAVLETDTGAARLKEFFTRSLHVVLNSVHRADTWRAMFRDLGDMKGVNNRNLFKDELIATGVSVIRGKVKELDGLYLMRQAHQTYYWPHVYDWITDPEWFPSYQIFQRRLIEELLRQDRLSAEQAQAVIRDAFWPYLAYAVTSAWRKEQAGTPREPSRLRAWAKRIPGLRRGWRAARSLLQRHQEAYSLPALLQPSSPDHADFMPMHRVVTTLPTQRVAGKEAPPGALVGAGARRAPGDRA